MTLKNYTWIKEFTVTAHNKHEAREKLKEECGFEPFTLFYRDMGVWLKYFETQKAKEKVSYNILMAMYRSVDRMNDHYRKGNDHGISSEEWLQVNLRKNFETARDGRIPE